jgi:hypothetical protein
VFESGGPETGVYPLTIRVENLRFAEPRQGVQNDVSSVLEMRHERTARLAQSMIATR